MIALFPEVVVGVKINNRDTAIFIAAQDEKKKKKKCVVVRNKVDITVD